MRVAKHQIGDKGNVQIGPIADNIVGTYRLTRHPYMMLPESNLPGDKSFNKMPCNEAQLLIEPKHWNSCVELYEKQAATYIYADDDKENIDFQLNLIRYEQWMQVVYHAGRERWIKSLFQRANLHGYNFNMVHFRHHIPGRLLLSFAFPPSFQYDFTDQDNRVIISDGIIIQGRITARILYKMNRSIKRLIIDSMGEDYGLVFDKIIQDLVKGYHSFVSPYTLDLDGVMPGKVSGFKHITSEIERSINEVKVMGEEYIREMISTKGYESTVAEIKLNKLFGMARAKIADILTSSIDKEIGIGVMMFSGAKGEPGQMIDAYGAMCLQGSSIYKPVHGTNRNTFFSHPDSISLDDFGFVFGNFYSGLNSLEMLFASIKSRKELINTSNITPITGFAEKELFKHMANARVMSDGTVRDINGNIIRQQVGVLGNDIQHGVPYGGPGEDAQFGDINSIALIEAAKKRYKQLVENGLVEDVEEDPLWTEEFIRDIKEEIEVYLQTKKR
jgi:DNA-directed RNA polymerase beta' subunit